jgi:hypothetical protein
MLAFVVALRQIAALRRVKANQSIDDALALYRVAVDHLDDGFGRRIGTNNDWFGWWILGTALRLAIYLATLVWPISMPSLIFAADVEGSFGELIWTLLSCSSGQLRRDPCSITSSARASSPCDSSSPSALAVFPEMAGPPCAAFTGRSGNRSLPESVEKSCCPNAKCVRVCTGLNLSV